MDLTLKKNINFLLKKHSLRPSKGLGQNFLINRGVIKKIIETSEIKPEDIILEIGPGLGTLTVELAKKAKKIIAVEKDPKMVDILKETLESFSNVEIIQEDILSSALNISMRAISGYKMVANLPYYIVAPVIKKFLEEKNLPEKLRKTLSSVVYQRPDGEILLRSDAVLQALIDIDSRWHWLACLALKIPRSWRDGVYNWVAARRKKFFSMRACPLPSVREKAQLLP